MEPIFTYKVWLVYGLVLAVIATLVRLVNRLQHRKQHHLPSGQKTHSAPAKNPAALFDGSSSNQDNAQIAASFFCGVEKYNCAQAILRTYQKRFSIQDADIVAARTKGYGKVPGGICGALYAGRLLLDDEHKSQQLTRDFESRTGSARCKQILQLNYLSCKECVALTARLLDSLFT